MVDCFDQSRVFEYDYSNSFATRDLAMAAGNVIALSASAGDYFAVSYRQLDPQLIFNGFKSLDRDNRVIITKDLELVGILGLYGTTPITRGSDGYLNWYGGTVAFRVPPTAAKDDVFRYFLTADCSACTTPKVAYVGFEITVTAVPLAADLDDVTCPAPEVEIEEEEEEESSDDDFSEPLTFTESVYATVTAAFRNSAFFYFCFAQVIWVAFAAMNTFF